MDFTYFRIVGSETYFDAFLSDKNLTKYDHWLYGYCNNDSDTKGIEYLINDEHFSNYACIRKYYSSIDRKYYDTRNPNFRWPEIAHGIYNPNYKFYNLFVQKCQENTINLILGEGYHCRNDTEIDDFISQDIIGTFHFVNHYTDILNYKNPNTKFIFRIETNFQKDLYSINHLNFNPSLVKTHNGLILEKVKEEKSYIYERNDVFTGDSKVNDIYCIYVLWLKNSMNYYERTYKKIQDVISSIGGINQVIILIATYINSFYNQYIVLSDTESLLHSSIDKEKGNKKIYFVNGKNKIKDLEKNNIKKNKEIYQNDKTNDIINKNKSENNILKSNITLNKNYEINNNNNSKNYINNMNKKEVKKDIKKIYKDKNFFHFILFKFPFKNKHNNFFEIYYNFRIKIISEEHLVKNYLNIYNLLKAIEKKKYFRKNSYKLTDLIKLV